MKKLLLLLAMAIMVIGLVAGCGKSADNGGLVLKLKSLTLKTTRQNKQTTFLTCLKAAFPY